MNNHFSSSSMASLILLVVLLASFSFPSISTSRQLLNDDRDQPDFASTIGFQAELRHVDSGRNFTRLEFLQRAMRRGKKRVQRLHAMALAASDPSIESPIHAENGEFLMDLAIGTPPVSYSAIVDTGSDLIWTQCKPCPKCYKQPTPIFDPKKSSSFSSLSCSSHLCDALPASICSNGKCEYLYTYGDYSSTQGIMGTETFTFGEVSVPKVGFGCGLKNQGTGFSQGGGLVGLGRGPLSLVSQLDEPRFAYCLTSIDSNKTSTLLMGSLASSPNSTLGTSLIKNPSQPSFYYLALKGITVGGKRLSLNESDFRLKEDGTGGMIIDSGTTITYLEESVFDVLKDEFAKQMKLPVSDSKDTGLELCFDLPSDAQEIEVPKLAFNFAGADLELPGKNYIIADSSGIACLAMGSSKGMSVFGNFQQQNILVIHDLAEETVSFVPQQC